MAPQKRKSDFYDTSDPFVADEDNTTNATDGVDANSVSKRAKKEREPSRTTDDGFSSAAQVVVGSGTRKKDDEGNFFWEISKARRVSLSSFRGKTMVSIREHYEKDGRWLPGKKGISMTLEQYNALVRIMPQIERTLLAEQTVENGEVVRPNYDLGSVTNDDNDDNDAAAADEQAERKIKGEKRGFEDVVDGEEGKRERVSRGRKENGKRKGNYEATSSEDEG